MYTVSSKNNGPSATGTYVILDTTKRVEGQQFAYREVAELDTYGSAWERAQEMNTPPVTRLRPDDICGALPPLAGL